MGTAGFSLRDNLLEKQGVTDMAALRWHLNNAYDMITAAPSIMRAWRYRVSPINPNLHSIQQG